MFINYILSENTKNAAIKELIEKNKVLKKQFRDSLNVCITKYISIQFNEVDINYEFVNSKVEKLLYYIEFDHGIVRSKILQI